MRYSLLHNLLVLSFLSSFMTCCYLDPKRESDTSEEGLKGRVKSVSVYLDEECTIFDNVTEYDRYGYKIRTRDICTCWNYYKYDRHGYLKEYTSGHLSEWKLVYDNKYDSEGRIMQIVGYEESGENRQLKDSTRYTYNEKELLSTISKKWIDEDSTTAFMSYMYDDKNRIQETRLSFIDNDGENIYVKKYDTLGNILICLDNSSDTLQNKIVRSVCYYDSLGYLYETMHFNVKDSVVGKDVYKNDDHGNWIEKIHYDMINDTLNKEQRVIKYY